MLNRLAFQNKLITEKLEKILSLPLVLTKLISEYAEIDKNLPFYLLEVISYQFFLKRTNTQLEKSEFCISGIDDINVSLVLNLENSNNLKSFLSYFSKLDTLQSQNIIQFMVSHYEDVECVARGYPVSFLKRVKEQYNWQICPDIVLWYCNVGCRVGSDHHIILKSYLGKTIGIALAIEEGFVKGKDVTKLLLYLEKLKAPLEFAQASLLIAYYRYCKRTDITNLFPLISAFLGGQEAFSLNTSYFEQSATFKVLTESKIISPKDYEQRSSTLRNYAQQFSFLKHHRPLAKKILKKIDHAGIKTEAYVNYHIFSAINDAKRNSQVTFKENGDFMKGINKLKA